MTYHFLKIAPEWFCLAVRERKTFEIRKDDRRFQKGDDLVLMEYAEGQYTGRYTIGRVLTVVTHEMFPDGIKEGYCVMGFYKNVHGPTMMLHVSKAAREQGIDPALLEVQL